MSSLPATPRTPSEFAQWRGAADLGGRLFGQITQRVHEWHRAISDLPFDALARAPGLREGSAPVRALHDGITDGVYTAVQLTGTTVIDAAAMMLRAIERTALAENRPQRDLGAHGAQLVGALGGLVGDDMAARRNPLAPRLGFYAVPDGAGNRSSRRLELRRDALAAACPDARPRLAIFVHGLCCTEHAWSLYRDEQPADAADYGTRIAALGYSPLYLRYNSGLHISQNGRLFARALDRLFAEWPVPVEDVVLIGHSMGGLVARAAAHSGAQRRAPWTDKVSHVFCIGSPHLGAPLEQAVNLGVAHMRRYPLSRPLARLLGSRSAGIKDLRQGATHDSDWRGRDPDALGPTPRAAIARISGARYHFLGSTLGNAANDRLARTLGDGLVDLPSATARELADADSATLTRVHHIRLLNHPLVWHWLDTRLRGH
ncbi:esterase/lipase family protein [Sinimarinibacterium flocculans]|uniref:esterase/lipase family protein n=1 Tax=Sinimarinibacterium flocculans TaxID=985250 RepID=UPI0035160909